MDSKWYDDEPEFEVTDPETCVVCDGEMVAAVGGVCEDCQRRFAEEAVALGQGGRR